MPTILSYQGVYPKISDSAFIAKGAVIIGDVEIGPEASIWFGCVVRGDVNHIRIGARTNVQDGTVIHVTRKTHPTIIGSGVTIGHSALLHGGVVEDDSFIGMRATVMDGARVSSGGMLAAGALLTPNKKIEQGQLWAGSPAKHFRELTRDEAEFIGISAQNYVELAAEYHN